MNDYLTLKTIDAQRQDSARRQRNADYLAEIEPSGPSLRERMTAWWMQRTPPPDVSLAQRTQRLQTPPCTPVPKCAHAKTSA